MTTSQSLNEIQRWMQSVITHPEGIKNGIESATGTSIAGVSINDIEQVILPSREMNSLSRLQVYGHAYFGRLVECLAAQFPALHHAIGEEAFNGLAYGYLIRHPSGSYTLASLGQSFDTYLEATRPPRSESHESDSPDFADFLIDLVTLERTYNEVFDGPGPEQSDSLQSSDLQEISPEEFAGYRLTMHSWVRLLTLRFPVHEYATLVRKNADPSPEMPRPVHLVVTRRDYIVRRFEIAVPQFELLSALAEGHTIGEALARILAGPDVDINQRTGELHHWFRDWTTAPLFKQIVRG